MSPSEDIRYYLTSRIAFILADIDKSHREIEHLNNLLRAAHVSDIQTEPPIRQPPIRHPARRTSVTAQSSGAVHREPVRQKFVEELGPHPAVRPLFEEGRPPSPRPKLNPSKSTPALTPLSRPWPRDSVETPLRRPAVGSQSRYPPFPRTGI